MVYRLTSLGREAGFKGLFAGLGPRMIMTAGLVSSQFLMYGAVKNGVWTFSHMLIDFENLFVPSFRCSPWFGDSQGNMRRDESYNR